MKKRAMIALALCTALFVGGCGKEEVVVEEKTLRSVEVTTVGTGEISSEFAYTGKAAPSKEVSVVPTVPGKVTAFNYELGDRVGEGAVLFTVDATDLQNNMRSLEASYNAAKLGYENAKTTYENNKILFDEEIISEQEFNQITYAYESAAAGLESIQVQMDNLNKSIGDCAVTSPMSGVISKRGVEVGGFASQASPAYTIMDLSTIKVEVGVSEQAVNTIKIGDKVQVLMTAASEEPLTGTVTTIAPAVSQTGMYAVSVHMDNSKGKIKVGMLAEVSFTMESSSNAIVLPVSAVIEKEEEVYVYIVEDGKAKKTPVTTGIESGETIEITSGLADGMQIVTKGQTYVSDGEAVNVVAIDGVDVKPERKAEPADASEETEDAEKTTETEKEE